MLPEPNLDEEAAVTKFVLSDVVVMGAHLPGDLEKGRLLLCTELVPPSANQLRAFGHRQALKLCP